MAKLGAFHPRTSRKRRSWAWLFWLLVLVGMVSGLHFRWGLTPPIARFLSPFEGAWQIVFQDYHTPGKYILKGRDGKIEIELDGDLIPHISAQSQRDLFFAQGFITAQHRLWQMDFQNLAAAGRLSEVVGERTLELDRFQRRFGIAEAARLSGEMMMRDSTTRNVLLAYTEGINEAIDQWPVRQLPIEFKILDYKPEPWKPENTGLLLKRMAYTLSAHSDDKALNLAMEKFGKPVCDQLFPEFMVDEEPIIPKNTPWNFTPLPIPKVPLALGWSDTTDDGIPVNAQPKLEDDNGIGSNNWAVSGTKTKSGYPILANDPHLSLKLPSTFYIAELDAPGIHVMGASLPGSPGIISGFNEKFAWGVTNGYPDVTDWFKVSFKDNSRKQYWFNGEWRNLRKKIETIRIRNQSSFTDTVYWTDLGPVVYRRGEKPKENFVPQGHALRWVGHDPGNELKAFLSLNSLSTVAEVPEALKTYFCPAQNFVAADNQGHIAMFAQQGKIPLRWKEQGKFLLLAGSAEQHWQGYIPMEHLPRVVDPPSGFVSSANQVPADSSYPYYLNWNYYSLERARRINNLLSEPVRFDLLRMQQIQIDNRNLWAEKTLPQMLKAVKNVADRPRWITDVLARWNYKNDPSEIGPTLFETWFKQWMELAWSDDFGDGMRYPDKHVTWQIFLEKDNSSWFDIRNTPESETGTRLLILALARTADSLQKQCGSLKTNPVAYHWGNFKATRIDHLGRIKGLGTDLLYTGGGKGIVNATSSEVGQSWKMLVQLGLKPQALGIYPGGQSGNPSSGFYASFTEPWRTGQYRKMKFR
jgi:penicillin amidase